MKINEMKEGLYYMVTKNSKCYRFQEGDTVKLGDGYIYNLSPYRSSGKDGIPIPKIIDMEVVPNHNRTNKRKMELEELESWMEV